MNRVKDGSRASGRDPQGLDAKHESLTAKPERPDLVSKLTSLMPKVTEGAWTHEVHELSEGYSAIVYDAFGRAIADHLDEPTAQLIALAPELATAFLAQSTILEEAVSALEKIAASDLADFNTLNLSGCARKARQTLTRIRRGSDATE